MELRLPRADNARVAEIKGPEAYAQVIPFKLQADRLGREAHRQAEDARAEAEHLRQVHPKSLSIAAYLREAEKWSAEARRQELRWKLITRLLDLGKA